MLCPEMGIEEEPRYVLQEKGRAWHLSAARTMIGRSHRRHRTGEYRRILCPTNFSSVADIGVERAARLAGRDRATLVLLHVYPPVAIYAPPEVAGVAWIRSDEVWRAQAERDLRRSRDHFARPGWQPTL